ncbi:MAG: hypothetical protein AAF125_08625 [Chloroflexota bacterium]
MLLLGGAVLRFSGLSFGQPPDATPNGTIHEAAALHPDEFLFVQRPLRMLLTDERNPKFFHNPSFLINTNYVVFWLTGERANMTWDERADLSARSQAPFRLYITARTFSALGGMLAVAATYAGARILSGHWGGIVAAAVVSASLPMVQHAHYATTSSLAAGFVAVSVWASLAALRGTLDEAWIAPTNNNMPWPWLFVLGGACAGLAAGNRYNAAAVSIVVFLAGCVLMWRARRMVWWVLVGWILFPVVFVFTTPHVIFDTAFVWSEFQFITNQYIGDEQNPLNVSPWLGLWYEVRYLVVFGVGLPGAVLVLIGVWRGWVMQRIETVILLAFLLPYTYVVLRTIRPLGADQMLVPIVPTVALFVGMGATRASQYVSRWVIGGVVMLPLLWFSVPVVVNFTLEDNRYQAADWAEQHLPEGARVHLYGPYNAPLNPTQYEMTQTFGTGETLSLGDVESPKYDIVIVSDAWIRHFERARYVDRDYAEAVLGAVDTLDAYRLYTEWSRWWVPGSEDAMHSATYWHQPGIRVYCLTELGCGSLD